MEASAPGCRGSLEATWLMGRRDVPQPDITLAILPEQGGQSGLRACITPGLRELDLAGVNAVVQQCLATPEHAEFAAQLAARKG